MVAALCLPCGPELSMFLKLIYMLTSTTILLVVGISVHGMMNKTWCKIQCPYWM
jgi:hypothetical protein